MMKSAVRNCTRTSLAARLTLARTIFCRLTEFGKFKIGFGVGLGSIKFQGNTFSVPIIVWRVRGEPSIITSPYLIRQCKRVFVCFSKRQNCQSMNPAITVPLPVAAIGFDVPGAWRHKANHVAIKIDKAFGVADF
jgi:hypothetical protein